MGRLYAGIAFGLTALACNPDPGELNQQVGYRVGAEDAASSGERGSVRISEVLWSGSVNAEGVRDQSDVYVELRNESARPINVSGWFLEISGPLDKVWRIPDSETIIGVGEHVYIAAKTTGCFPDPDYVLPTLELPDGDPFRLTLRDADERLIEPIGSRDMPPFAGGWDLVDSRSMERVELMFGGYGTEPRVWHFYTDAQTDQPNFVRILESCRAHTLGSPGKPNSPDYSGAYSTGSFE